MEADLWAALPGALARGALTAVVIGVLLLAAQRFGRSAVGLLSGLPTVTGPAMLWLALDRGAAFASTAAVGAVAAGIACALFALGYGLASRRRRPPAALGFALLASALPLPWLALPQWPVALWLALASAVCLACQGALGVLVQIERDTPRPLRAATDPSAVAATATPPVRPGRGWLTTAVVSGVVSALAAALAGTVGPFWAGMLTSPPLLAAAVAYELHRRQGGRSDALGFLHGYAAGLLGRGLFVTAFGVLLPASGPGAAFAAAVALSLVAGWLSGIRLDRRPVRVIPGSEGQA
jgi:hypothetical protein